MPLLLPADERPDQAAVRRWLALSEEASLIGTAWSGLTYQTLLTQGQQQSLSVESGLLECGWVVALQERLGRGVVAFWRSLLAPGAAALDEQHEQRQDRPQYVWH